MGEDLRNEVCNTAYRLITLFRQLDSDDDAFIDEVLSCISDCDEISLASLLEY